MGFLVGQIVAIEDSFLREIRGTEADRVCNVIKVRGIIFERYDLRAMYSKRVIENVHAGNIRRV